MIGAGLGATAALVALNVYAIYLGERAPWLMAGIMVADMLAVAGGIAGGIRYIIQAEQRSALAQASALESQTRRGAILEAAMDAIVTVDAEHRIVLFNRAAENVFRCRRDEVLGSKIDRFIPARFREAHRGHIERFGQTGMTNRRMGDVTLLWGLRADGEEFPIEASISQTREGETRFFTVILRDVTRRKEFEDRLKAQQAELRELSARVLEAREEEKTVIARELHDELGQMLTALKMDLAWLRERLPAAEPELGGKAAQMNALLDRTVGSVRRISSNLRPLMLDDLGLEDALAWLVDDFAARSEIALDVELPKDGALDGVDRPVANAVYRVLQESLTNIARHSQAKRAWVVLNAGGSNLQLEIEDDGRGIAEADLARSRSLGLKGMRERVLYLGGSIEVARAPRGGTRVMVRLPRLAAPGAAP
jgi:PAS domain S-box-containing protein